MEESFNLQASHDLFYYGLGPAWKSWWNQDNFGSVVDVRVDDDVARASCESTAGGRGQAESCSLRIDASDLPYDHVKFPGGRFLFVDDLVTSLINLGRILMFSFILCMECARNKKLSVVPRTFMGAFLLSSIAKTISFIIPKQILDLPSHPMLVQFVIRLELLLLSWLAHLRLSGSIARYFQRRMPQMNPTASPVLHPPPIMISNYYLLITASQFHLPFYSSRLLPNTFALILATHAYADWFNDRPHRAAALLVISTVVFRCDTLLLLFTIGLMMLIRRQLTIVEAICTGVISGLFGLLLTVPLDSLLWGRPIWPEFEVLWFNTVSNRSSEWGTMPYHWYLTSALPRGMLLTAPLVPLAFVRMPEFIIIWTTSHLGRNKKRIQMDELQFGTMFDLCLLPLFVAVLGFVLLYSFLPHKEIRFIFPAVPVFNLCAAYGMSRLDRLALPCVSREEAKKKSMACDIPLLVARGMYLCGVATIACTLLGSLVFIRMSKENYPGGAALSRLKQYLDARIPMPSSMPQLQTSLGMSHSLTANNELQFTKWEDVSVHVDVAAAMTGVSLFGQRHASHRWVDRGGMKEGPFHIEKSGYEDENNVRDSSLIFTHLLTEHQQVEGYHNIDTILGHPQCDFNNFRIDVKEAIFILERDGW